MVPIIGRSRGNNGAKEEEIKVKAEINTLCTLENSTAAANDSGAVGAHVKGAPPMVHYLCKWDNQCCPKPGVEEGGV